MRWTTHEDMKPTSFLGSREPINCEVNRTRQLLIFMYYGYYILDLTEVVFTYATEFLFLPPYR